MKNNIVKLDIAPVVEYDKNGNIVHYRDSNSEYWKEYDESGNMIHYKHSSGFECWGDTDDATEVKANVKKQVKKNSVLRSVTALSLVVNTLLSVATVWSKTFVYTTPLCIIWIVAQIWTILVVNANIINK